MHKIEIFLVTNIITIALLLLCQTISVRIISERGAVVTIEYFPFQIILFNFRIKRKKRNRIKEYKKFLFFFSPVLKSLNFLLKRTDVKILNFSLSDSKSDEPHTLFLSQKIKDISKIYIYSIVYALSKSAYISQKPQPALQNENTSLDFELTTKLYNLLSAFAVLFFFSIKKIGRNKKIV